MQVVSKGGEELRYLHEYLYHVPTDVAPAR